MLTSHTEYGLQQGMVSSIPGSGWYRADVVFNSLTITTGGQCPQTCDASMLYVPSIGRWVTSQVTPLGVALILNDVQYYDAGSAADQPHQLC